MKPDKKDGRLWKSARLLMKGAYSSTEWVPPTEEPQEILDFLHFHISLPQRTAAEDESIYYAFRSIVINPSPEKRRAVATYNFDGPLLIGTLTQLLSNRDNMLLQRMSLLVLPELDTTLFTSEAAFGDHDKTSDFVEAWSEAIGGFLHGPMTPHIEVAAVKVLLAIANLPCLRKILPPERWNLIYKFPTVLYSDSPSMQRCIQNSDILPHIKKFAGHTDALGWLGMLWMKYHSLPKEVRGQLEDETRTIGSSKRYYDLDSYVSLFDAEVKRLRAKIEDQKPLDQSVPGLRAELDTMERSKGRLVQLQEESRELRLAGPQSSPQSPMSSPKLGGAARALLGFTGKR